MEPETAAKKNLRDFIRVDVITLIGLALLIGLIVYGQFFVPADPRINCIQNATGNFFCPQGIIAQKDGKTVICQGTYCEEGDKQAIVELKNK